MPARSRYYTGNYNVSKSASVLGVPAISRYFIDNYNCGFDAVLGFLQVADILKVVTTSRVTHDRRHSLQIAGISMVITTVEHVVR